MTNPAVGLDPAEVVAKADADGLHDHVIFSTSGSTGEPKLVALSREALACSAGAVNRAIGARAEDLWLRALPDFHVGGYAIGVRAELANCAVRVLDGKWDPGRFVAGADGATLCSLVPTQVFDIVEGGFQAPPSLRVVLVGGGQFSHHLRVSAEALGWPVRATYGMTETSSSVAIADAEGSLRLLDIWHAEVGQDDELMLSGDGLFTRYIGGDAAGKLFATGDRVELGDDLIKVIGRVDAMVKVLGERVDLDALQRRLPNQFAICALPEPRAGNRLVLVAECDVGEVLSRYNSECAGFERLSEFVRVDQIPRSPLGKLRREALVAQISEMISDA